MANTGGGGNFFEKPLGEARDSGSRTPAVPSSPSHRGDPPPKTPQSHPRSVEEYGHQNDSGEKPTKGVYRQGVRIR